MTNATNFLHKVAYFFFKYYYILIIPFWSDKMRNIIKKLTFTTALLLSLSSTVISSYTYADNTIYDENLTDDNIEDNSNNENMEDADSYIDNKWMDISYSNIDCQPSFTYTGNSITPSVTVTSPLNEVLIEGVDYILSYSNNHYVSDEPAVITISGIGRYHGENYASFHILPKDINSCSYMITGLGTYEYSGEAYTPVPTVTIGSTTLYNDNDFTCTYENNIKAGKAKVIIDFSGNYIGTITKSFTIKKKTYDSSKKTANGVKFSYISSSFTLACGQDRNLNAYLTPVKTATGKIVYTSSDPDIATVDSHGNVKAHRVGKVTITASLKGYEPVKKSVILKVTKRKTGSSGKESNLNIVSTKRQKYTYSKMVTDINAFKKSYSEFLTINNLGKTADKRNVYEIVLGNKNAKKQLLICGSTHAREYMTSLLIMKQIEFYCANYYTGTYNGKYFSEIFENTCIHFVPMLNPDGVTISQFGPSKIRDARLRANLYAIKKRLKGGSNFFTRWKANARGVDLNSNYASSSSIKFKNGLPRDMGYKGTHSISENESKIISNLFLKLKPDAMISYHATGSILYWNYGQTGKHYSNSVTLRNTVQSLTKYSLVKGISRGPGFSDWTSKVHKTPSLTVEIGTGMCPLSIKEFSNIWKRNRYVPVASALTVASKFKS